MSVLDRIGNEAGRLGDWLGIDMLRYNPVVIKKFDAMGARDAPHVIGAVRAQFPDARRWVDVGAGSAAFAAEAQRQGLDVIAIERSAHGRRRGRRHGVTVAPFDLEATPPAPVEGPFDLAYCFEVAEHLPESLGDRLVAYLCTLAPVIVFTAASRGQGGTGHVNEQDAAYWVARFSGHGYGCRAFRLATSGLSAHWSKTNKLVFLRERPPPAGSDDVAGP